jgi:hypothetical protein
MAACALPISFTQLMSLIVDFLRPNARISRQRTLRGGRNLVGAQCATRKELVQPQNSKRPPTSRTAQRLRRDPKHIFPENQL